MDTARHSNACHPNTSLKELRIAKLVLWAISPLNDVTLWAARVAVENKMRNAGIPVHGDEPADAPAVSASTEARKHDTQPFDENEDV